MDWINIKENGLELVKKYRYVLLVLLLGICLMALPDRKEPEYEVQQTERVEETNLQDALAVTLSLIEGAGKVEVLLTEAEGQRILYQTDEDISSGGSSSDVRTDTVLISGSDRTETGLIRQIQPPVYQGAIIVCQGGDSPKVRLSIVEAVMSVTGLSSDNITVVKMK